MMWFSYVLFCPYPYTIYTPLVFQKLSTHAKNFKFNFITIFFVILLLLFWYLCKLCKLNDVNLNITNITRKHHGLYENDVKPYEHSFCIESGLFYRAEKLFSFCRFWATDSFIYFTIFHFFYVLVFYTNL